ncbi:hypothetical protein WR25_06386 [Diploscapter pachys]|uniref:Uncharacterized protein n=1 Tax=Diploscapter pachys TaxID=2018661 RepID=A0A2A2LYR0_9BILA|nr:hypothetical protein WR25_06386 [Diploscapter pachys]
MASSHLHYDATLINGKRRRPTTHHYANRTNSIDTVAMLHAAGRRISMPIHSNVRRNSLMAFYSNPVEYNSSVKLAQDAPIYFLPITRVFGGSRKSGIVTPSETVTMSTELTVIRESEEDDDKATAKISNNEVEDALHRGKSKKSDFGAKNHEKFEEVDLDDDYL